MEQDPPSALVTNKIPVIRYLLIFTIGLVVGAGGILYLNPNSDSTEDQLSINEISYQAGFDDAKQIALTSQLGTQFLIPDRIKEISGMVTAVSNNEITIIIQGLNPFADQNLLERTILVESDTVFYELQFKHPTILESEIESFQSTEPNQATGDETLPELFTSIRTTAGSISIGAFITVTADENIKNAEEIVANEIRIYVDEGTHYELDHDHN